MKNAVYLTLELIIIALFDNKLFIKEKRNKPTLLSSNIEWFTNCNWVEQIIAFKQLDLYSCKS